MLQIKAFEIKNKIKKKLKKNIHKKKKTLGFLKGGGMLFINSYIDQAEVFFWEEPHHFR